MKNTILNYCEFTEDTCYILLMLARKKENKHQTEHDKLARLRRKTVQCEADVDYALKEFELHAKLYPETQFRIYVSVNKRSLVNGMLHFQKAIMDIQYALIRGNVEAYKTICRMNSEWTSTLATKECRAERNFLFDIDYSNSNEHETKLTHDFVKEVDALTSIKYFGKSKNGFALVTAPFNMATLKLPEQIELKTDDYLYVGGLNYE